MRVAPELGIVMKVSQGLVWNSATSTLRAIGAMEGASEREQWRTKSKRMEAVEGAGEREQDWEQDWEQEWKQDWEQEWKQDWKKEWEQDWDGFSRHATLTDCGGLYGEVWGNVMMMWNTVLSYGVPSTPIIFPCHTNMLLSSTGEAVTVGSGWARTSWRSA